MFPERRDVLCVAYVIIYNIVLWNLRPHVPQEPPGFANQNVLPCVLWIPGFADQNRPVCPPLYPPHKLLRIRLQPDEPLGLHLNLLDLEEILRLIGRGPIQRGLGKNCRTECRGLLKLGECAG